MVGAEPVSQKYNDLTVKDNNTFFNKKGEALMGYRVIYNFSDGSSEDLLGKIFFSKKKAQKAAEQGASDYRQGNRYLAIIGKECCEDEIIDWDIEKDRGIGVKNIMGIIRSLLKAVNIKL
jgi:hypothetical protein